MIQLAHCRPWSKKEEKRIAQVMRESQAEHRRQIAAIKNAKARAQAMARYNASVRVSSGSAYGGSGGSVGSGVNSEESYGNTGSHGPLK